MLPGEKALGFAAVRAKTSQGPTLDDSSRVNYSRVATVSHNQEVAFVGNVNMEDWHIVLDAFQKSILGFDSPSSQPTTSIPSVISTSSSLPSNEHSFLDRAETPKIPVLSLPEELDPGSAQTAPCRDQWRETVLRSAESSAMLAIQEQILASTTSPTSSSAQHLETPVEVTFQVPWDPHTFMETQGYSEPAHIVLAKIITLSGSKTDAQAMTTESFLAQTWPSTGPHLLKAVQKLLVETEKPHEQELHDRRTCKRITGSHPRAGLDMLTIAG